MLEQLLRDLSHEQRKTLEAHGITRQRRHEWLNGKANPTEVQVVLLASVTGTDWVELQREVTLRRATPDVRGILERAMGKIASGVKVTLICGAIAAAFGAGLFSAGPGPAFLRPR